MKLLFITLSALLVAACEEQKLQDRSKIGTKLDVVYVIDANSGACVQIDTVGKFNHAYVVESTHCKR
jgi:hypothetical protein